MARLGRGRHLFKFIRIKHMDSEFASSRALFPECVQGSANQIAWAVTNCNVHGLKQLNIVVQQPLKKHKYVKFTSKEKGWLQQQTSINHESNWSRNQNPAVSDMHFAYEFKMFHRSQSHVHGLPSSSRSVIWYSNCWNMMVLRCFRLFHPIRLEKWIAYLIFCSFSNWIIQIIKILKAHTVLIPIELAKSPAGNSDTRLWLMFRVANLFSSQKVSFLR